MMLVRGLLMKAKWAGTSGVSAAVLLYEPRQFWRPNGDMTYNKHTAKKPSGELHGSPEHVLRLVA